MRHPAATSPRRRALPLRRSAQPPPLLTLPLPPQALLTLSAATATVVYLTTRPLLAKLASLYLRTELTIARLRIAPFRRRITLSGLTLHDPRGRPLLSVPRLVLSLSKPSSPATTATTSAPPSRTDTALYIAVDNPAIAATFDSYDLSSSNWTLFTQNFLQHSRQSKPTSSKSTRRKPSPKPSPTPSPTKPPNVSISLTGPLTLSLTTSLPTPRPLLPPLTLSPPTLTAADILSPDSLSDFVETVIARAIKTARSRDLPRDFRTGARRYARRVLSESLADRVRVTRQHVTGLREQVEGIDRAVGSLPDVGVAREGLSALQNTLRGLEGLLGAAERQDPRGDNGIDAGTEGGAEEEEAEVRREESNDSGEEEKEDDGEAAVAEQFRELDEEYVPREQTDAANPS